MGIKIVVYLKDEDPPFKVVNATSLSDVVGQYIVGLYPEPIPEDAEPLLLASINFRIRSRVGPA